MELQEELEISTNQSIMEKTSKYCGISTYEAVLHLNDYGNTTSTNVRNNTITFGPDGVLRYWGVR